MVIGDLQQMYWMLHICSHLVCLRLKVINTQAPACLLMQVVRQQVPSIQCQGCLRMQFDFSPI